MSSENVLEIKSCSNCPIQNFNDRIKRYSFETNITFKPDGIRIVNMDKSHTILAHLYLEADKFEHIIVNTQKLLLV